MDHSPTNKSRCSTDDKQAIRNAEIYIPHMDSKSVACLYSNKLEPLGLVLQSCRNNSIPAGDAGHKSPTAFDIRSLFRHCEFWGIGAVDILSSLA
jgi:hypothetical protein